MRGNKAETADIRVRTVTIGDDELCVGLMEGRSISVPLAWYPRLANAPAAERAHWEIAGVGYGIYWPDVDADLSTEGLLRGARAVPVPRREIRGLDPGSRKGESLERES